MPYLGHFPEDHPAHPAKNGRVTIYPGSSQAALESTSHAKDTQTEAKFRTLPPDLAALEPKREAFQSEEAFEEALAFYRHRLRTAAR